jgi:hypothetical protein
MPEASDGDGYNDPNNNDDYREGRDNSACEAVEHCQKFQFRGKVFEMQVGVCIKDIYEYMRRAESEQGPRTQLDSEKCGSDPSEVGLCSRCRFVFCDLIGVVWKNNILLCSLLVFRPFGGYVSASTRLIKARICLVMVSPGWRVAVVWAAGVREIRKLLIK